MTTILGIQTNEGLDGIVLASDIQISLYEGKKVMGKRKHGRKIIVGPNYALAHAGNMEPALYSFKRYLTNLKVAEQKKIILSAVENYKENPKCFRGWEFDPHFIEINKLNTAIVSKGEDINETVIFILATNEPEIGLYIVDEYGNFRESPKERPFKYLSIGDGSEKAEEYIENLLNDDKIDPSNITIPHAIQIVKKAFNKAEEGMDTGGIPDYVIITKESIIPYGDEIRKAMEDAYESKVIEIGKKYSGEKRARSGPLTIVPDEKKDE